jgi:hypothetical protein
LRNREFQAALQLKQQAGRKEIPKRTAVTGIEDGGTMVEKATEEYRRLIVSGARGVEGDVGEAGESKIELRRLCGEASPL